jgi:hypothetical protein
MSTAAIAEDSAKADLTGRQSAARLARSPWWPTASAAAQIAALAVDLRVPIAQAPRATRQTGEKPSRIEG